MRRAEDDELDDVGYEPEPGDLGERRLVDPRSIPVRFSKLREMARSALHYFHACQSGDTDTLARKLGRGAHAMVLGTPVVKWTKKTAAGKSAPRNGKEWEAFKAANPGAEILNTTEHRASAGIANAIRNHPIAAAMLYKAGDLPEAIRRHPDAAPFLHRDGSLLEHEVDWTFLGRKCQSHIDVWRPGRFVADVKTARDGNPARFRKVAIWSGYHAQLAFYADAAKAAGQPVPEAYIIVVESAPPYAVTVMKLTDRALEDGRAKVRSWFERLKTCEASGSWHSYTQIVEELDAIDEDDLPLIVEDDEEVELES